MFLHHAFVGCGVSGSPGTCSSCADNEYFNAQDNSCTAVSSNQRRLTITCSDVNEFANPLCAGLTADPKPQTQSVQECGPNSADRSVTNNIPKFAYDVCRCQDGYVWDEDATQCTACGNNVYFANNIIASPQDSDVQIYDPTQAYTTCTSCPETQGHHADAITSIDHCFCLRGYENVAPADGDEPERVSCTVEECITLPTKCEPCAAGSDQKWISIDQYCRHF